MVDLPFELRYELSRRQRLIPHLKIWDGLGLIILCVLAGLLAGLFWFWWPGLLVLAWIWFFRKFFLGLADVALHRVVRMDLRVEENGLGFLAGRERWWLFLDGLLSIEQLTRGVWTLQFWNGSVIHVPATVITEAQLGYLRAAMEHGRQPEQIQAVIERGRAIERLKTERQTRRRT